MISIKTDLPGRYRARAEEARRKAETETDEVARKALLNDAELWERMAAYEDANRPTSG